MCHATDPASQPDSSSGALPERGKCAACEGLEPVLERRVIQERLWNLRTHWFYDPIERALKAYYKFANFKKAAEFAQAVGCVCEELGYHAVITFGWGYAIVVIKTDSVGGVTETSFTLMRNIDNDAVVLGLVIGGMTEEVVEEQTEKK